MSDINNLDDIGDLLDKNLDDIADLPEFKTFHPGAHKVKINWERKDFDKVVDGVKKKVPSMQLTLTYIEVIEHADAKHNDEPAKAGDKCSTSYDLTNEFALGALKKATASLKSHLGAATVGDVIRGSNDFEVAAITKTRADKNDKSKLYLVIEDLIPA
jgi:hypothetical protein